jgi:hypothetical protein
MSRADWLEFVLRLTTKFDTRYVIGAFADPGDLLNYFLSIVPVAGQMCTMELTWTTTFPCACQAEWRRERRVSGQEIMISVDSEAPLIYHVLAAFNPEAVTDYVKIGVPTPGYYFGRSSPPTLKKSPKLNIYKQYIFQNLKTG